MAVAGFGSAADAYERGRPTYPPAVLDAFARELGVGPGCDVLDLAAGTGKLTRLLVATGARVVAVEPLAAMRAHVSGIEVLEGTAEAIPLPDASVDVVTVGQAFHWFDRDAALAEVRRVLRPGGGLGLVWNERDKTVPWVAELELLFDEGVPRPYDKDVDWLAVLEAWGGEVGRATIGWDQHLDEDGLVDRVLSTSYVAVLPEEHRSSIAARIRDLVAGFPADIRLPHLTDVYWCRTSS